MPIYIPEMFECEICGKRYSTMLEAIECERTPINSYPIGCIYADHRPEAMYKNMTFAVEKNKYAGHMNCGLSWVARDRFEKIHGESTCGSNVFLNLTEKWGNIDINRPSFIRLVKWLKEKNISITVWNGKKPVPYDEYMAISRILNGINSEEF